MNANGSNEFFTLPGEIVSDENLDRIVGGKSVRKGRRRPPKPRKRPRRFG